MSIPPKYSSLWGKPARMRGGGAVALFASLTLSGCAPTFVHQPAPLPDPDPDVILVTLSGRCGFTCQSADNWDYLTASGGTAAISDWLRQRGRHVRTISGTAQVQDTYRSRESAAEQHGYPWVKAQLAAALAEFPRAQIIVMGHSHGSVFGHQLVRDFPATRFRLLIDLDTQCLLWTDYRQSPYAGGCAPDPAHRGQRASDVTPDNVEFNLEVQSSGSDVQRVGQGLVYSPIRDRVPNIRPDGTRRGIVTLRSSDNHIMMPRAGSQSMTLVRGALEQLGF